MISSKSILQATGGWPCLIDYFFDHCKGDNPRSITDEIDKLMSDPDSELGTVFYNALGLEANKALRQATDFILQEERPDRELLMLLLKEASSLTSDGCKQVLEYLKKMSCLEIENDTLSVEPAVRRTILSKR